MGKTAGVGKKFNIASAQRCLEKYRSLHHRFLLQFHSVLS